MDPAVLEPRVGMRWVRQGWIFTWSVLLASPPRVLPRSGHRGHGKGSMGRGHGGCWGDPRDGLEGSVHGTALAAPPRVAPEVRSGDVRCT